jgi:hypothetical protein
MTEQAVTPEGALGAEVRRHTEHDGIIREVEVGFILDGRTARQIAEILNKHADFLEIMGTTQEGKQ